MVKILSYRLVEMEVADSVEDNKSEGEPPQRHNRISCFDQDIAFSIFNNSEKQAK